MCSSCECAGGFGSLWRRRCSRAAESPVPSGGASCASRSIAAGGAWCSRRSIVVGGAWHTRRRQRLSGSAWLFGVLTLLVGCASEHPCLPERCDGLDNDCDGRIDEDFLNADGLLVSADHCGGCALKCADVFPSAVATQCSVQDGEATCQISDCGAGARLAGASACVPDAAVVCLACDSDDDCAVRSPDARCLTGLGAGGRCGQACRSDIDCPSGFRCAREVGASAQCLPLSGACACSEAMQGASFACELRGPAPAQRCAGQQTCSAEGLSACEAALAEQCNGADDDCDGRIDEDFRDDQGRYLDAQHCGGCDSPCVAAGAHQRATCRAKAAAVSCEIECADGFVDVDGLAANGCECQLSSALVPLASADRDCDGLSDPSPELLFVSKNGDDQNAGTSPALAVASVTRGLALAAQLGRPVLVAGGVYRERVTLPAGVGLRGGYSADFLSHDPALYPVQLEAPADDPGAPVLLARDIVTPTSVADIGIAASDAVTPGQGSSAMFLDGCSDALELSGIDVLAGRGANGGRGADSSEFGSLDDLAGVSGGEAAAGGSSCSVAAGSGGTKRCADREVSGGGGGPARCAALSCDNQSSSPCGNAGCSDFTSDGVCDIEAARRAASPNPSAQSGRGASPGAAGASTFDAPTNHGVCSYCDDNPSLPRAGGDGTAGADGVAGSAGTACTAALGLDPSGRISAADGGGGEAGRDGSGGGGGSAGAGYAVIGSTTGTCSSVAGAGGGGGGSGGCGAPPAAGGGGGGASIGLVIRLRAGQTQGPRLSQLRIVTASAGDGGDGGVGSAGGAGGSGGRGGTSTFWCARSGGHGGDGGSGGAGGGGAGGCGGVSLGIYLLPNASTLGDYSASLHDNVVIESTGAAGRGGRGGFSPVHPGLAGMSGRVASIL
jgi:hypothetical protein